MQGDSRITSYIVLIIVSECF